MNCKHCKAQWTAPQDKSLSKCPFCHVSLIDPTQVGNNASPDIILQQVVEQFDVAILGDKRLGPILSDFMPHVERRYLKIFKQAVEDGIGARLLELINEDAAIRTATIHTLKSSFRQNNGFDHTSDYVVDCFLLALGWVDSAQEQAPETAVLGNGLSILKAQLEQAISDNRLTQDEIKMLFGIGSSLDISAQDIATMINEVIKQKGLKPATPVDSKIKNPKDILASCDWILKSKSENEEYFNETTNNLNLEMILVEAGTFTMGATAEQDSDAHDDNIKPTHKVRLDSFYIGKYPVTQRQWLALMGNNPSYFSGCDNCPVEQVSWNDVQEFIHKLNQMTGKTYRLPTEAQWEFAARGGSAGLPTKYAGSKTINDVAWCSKNSGIKTHPVGQKRPNELGIYDMSGNVWEWCSDWYDSYTSGAQTNPTGAVAGTERVIRGGCSSMYASYCRVSDRHRDTPGSRDNRIGFRLALDP